MEKKARFDFEIEEFHSDNESGLVQFCLKPDARRYITAEVDGIKYYRDKYLNTLISLEEMRTQMAGLPIFRLSPSITSTPEYALRRRERVTEELKDGEYHPPAEKAAKHQDFATTETRDIAFLSVDICGATAYRRRNPREFDRAYEVFIRELGTLVGHFNGAILKTTGDGFIAYVDHPSFTSQCDATADLGLSLILLVKGTVNPALTSAGLRPLTVRIGGDYGPASTRKIEIPSTNYRSIEVASDALNRAVKIEESCEPGQFRIGRELYELLHVKWLERATEVSFDGKSVGIDNYKVYILR